jgi:hypothetical protein
MYKASIGKTYELKGKQRKRFSSTREWSLKKKVDSVTPWKWEKNKRKYNVIAIESEFIAKIPNFFVFVFKKNLNSPSQPN